MPIIAEDIIAALKTLEEIRPCDEVMTEKSWRLDLEEGRTGKAWMVLSQVASRVTAGIAKLGIGRAARRSMRLGVVLGFQIGARAERVAMAREALRGTRSPEIAE